jgi:hypothetical protein
MTMALERPAESADETKARLFAKVRVAVEAYWVGLAKIVRPDQVESLEDDDDFDYAVRVQRESLLEVEDRLIDLSLSIQDKYGIKITTLPLVA